MTTKNSTALQSAHIGVIASGNVQDVKTWSGVPHFMVSALERQGHRITNLNDSDRLKWSENECRVDRWSNRIFGKGYLPGQNIKNLTRVAEQIDSKISETTPDFILAITVDQIVPFLKTKLPIVHHSDTTFDLIHDYYPKYTNLWDVCVKRGNNFTQNTLNRSTLCTFPSQCAANNARSYYNIPEDKIKVIPYGANLMDIPKTDTSELPETECCQLLFIGVDWKRKGGELVFETFIRMLNDQINTRLVVVGCKPPYSHEKMTVIPFLNKQIDEELELYEKLWQESSFLFMPSLMETFGAIYAEAAADGLPAIALDTGGVSDCVKHKETGYLLPLGTTAETCADIISTAWNDKEGYRDMSKRARQRFVDVLNWDSWASNLIDFIVKKEVVT